MEAIKIEDNKNNIVKKHNELISKARYSLSESGIKLVSMLISMIKINDLDFQEYYISINDFTNLTGSNSKNNYAVVHSVIKELLSTPLKIDNAQMNFCYYGKYVDGSATAIFKIAPELKPYLLKLKKDFVRYNIKDILSLKSSYVIRLYELFIQKWNNYKKYNKNSKSFTFELEVYNMRELFEIPKSQLYGDIKRHILDKAKKQFKEKTNIQFEYKEQKLGRKVVRLQIIIKENLKGSNDTMSNLKSFIAWIRKDFINADLFHIKNKQCISVNPDGRLYDKYQNEIIDNKRSQEIWEKLYQLAKENKLKTVPGE